VSGIVQGGCSCGFALGGGWTPEKNDQAMTSGN
jgi:hypothetical protein